MDGIQSRATLICMIYRVQSADSCVCVCDGRSRWRDDMCVQQPSIRYSRMHRTYHGQRHASLLRALLPRMSMCVCVFVFLLFQFCNAQCTFCTEQSIKTECVISRYDVHRAHHVILRFDQILWFFDWNRGAIYRFSGCEPNQTYLNFI